MYRWNCWYSDDIIYHVIILTWVTDSNTLDHAWIKWSRFLCMHVLPMVKMNFGSKFDECLSLHCAFVKPKFKTAGISLVVVRIFPVMISKIYNLFWPIFFFKCSVKSSSIFYPIGITWRKMARWVCLKPVKEIVMFAYIMTFHCTSV